MKFSIISLLIPLAGLLAAGCSSSRVASTEYDDVYYSSRDVTSRTVETTQTTTYPEYRSEATGQAAEDGELNPEYSSASSGNTYVTNNYQTEYYRRDYFGSRYDPLYRPSAYQLSYWDVPYNNYYWYDPYAPNFNLAVYSSPFYHRHYGWYDSPFYGGYGYPVRPGVTISIGFGYYNYWGWNPYNTWGGYYGGYGHYNNYYNGYYRGFHDGVYAGGNRRTTHYGRRQDRSVVPTSGISASGGGRVTPNTRPNRDGRIEGGGKQQTTGTQPVNDQRSIASPAVREERGIKPGREVPAGVQQSRQEAVPANTEVRPAPESKPVGQYDSAPRNERNETGVKPGRQLNEQARPAEQRPVPNEVKPSRQETVRPENYQFQEQQARPVRTNETPVRSHESEYVPARDREQIYRPDRQENVQQEQYRPAPERQENMQPEQYRPAPERPVNVRPERPRSAEPQIERPTRQEQPVYRQEQPARQMQERSREQRPTRSYEQPSRNSAPVRESRPMNNSGGRMRPRN